MKKSSTWNDLLKPVVVLTVICLLVSGALAATNGITAPIIEENAKKAADATRIALLPEAEAFEQVEYTGTGVREVYKATNGVGYVITGVAKGYDGDVPVVVAFGADGKIVATSITGTNETPGLGKNVEDGASNFQDQLVGLAAEEVTLGKEITPIGGATITSSAVADALNNAIVAYKAVALGEVQIELTEEERVAAMLGDETVTLLNETTYQGASGYAFKTSGVGYEGNPVYCLVAINLDGQVVGLEVDASTQSGPGPRVAKEAYTSTFIGVTADGVEGVDALANATFSSQGVKEAIAAAFTLFDTVKGA